jgi:hypothetical protein
MVGQQGASVLRHWHCHMRQCHDEGMDDGKRCQSGGGNPEDGSLLSADGCRDAASTIGTHMLWRPHAGWLGGGKGVVCCCQ